MGAPGDPDGIPRPAGPVLGPKSSSQSARQPRVAGSGRLRATKWALEGERGTCVLQKGRSKGDDDAHAQVYVCKGIGNQVA